MKRKPTEPLVQERSKSDQAAVEGHTSSQRACFDLTLRIGLEQVRIRASIPQGPISIPEFLPIVQSLTDAVMAAVARGAKREQRLISCGPGCGACCRQLVPIGEAEAIYLKGILNGLEKDRRARIRERFGIAEKKLRESGLLDDLRSADKLQDRDERREIGLRYFRLGIPCPFLEDESCGIHPHRPLACREYVVTSHPRHCARPATGHVETLELPRRPSALFYRFGDGVGSAPARWLALPLALERIQSRAVRNGLRTFCGPELFTAFVRRLANAEGEETGSPGIGHR